jgi:hypothetical protein
MLLFGGESVMFGRGVSGLFGRQGGSDQADKQHRECVSERSTEREREIDGDKARDRWRQS